jgi:hypothetical protein
VTAYRVVAEPPADLDVAATFDWHETEHAGLGREFLDELRATYGRRGDGPLGYKDLRSGIREAEPPSSPSRGLRHKLSKSLHGQPCLLEDGVQDLRVQNPAGVERNVVLFPSAFL